MPDASTSTPLSNTPQQETQDKIGSGIPGVITPASIFAIQSHESEFELCEMLNYDLQWQRDENLEEYGKDNDAFDKKCLKEALELVNFEDWKNYDDIVHNIEDARNLFDDEEEDDSQ